MRMPKLVLTVAVALVTASARADSEPFTWLQLLSQGKVGQWRLWAEAQPRYSFKTPGLATVLLRPGVGYQVTPELSAWIGYAWTPLVEPVYRDEHRIWAQGILALNALGGMVTQRLRLESRFIGTTSGAALRLRYLARLAIPFAAESGWSAVVYDEIFFAMNSRAPVAAAGFDQNRLFVGTNYRFGDAIAIDVGYLWNAVKRAAAAENHTNHVAMVTLYHYFGS